MFNKKQQSSDNSQSSTVKSSKIKKIVMLFVILLVCLSLIPWVIGNKKFASTNDRWIQVGGKYTPSNILLGEYSSFMEKNYYYVKQNPYAMLQFLNSLISQYVTTLLFANEAENIQLAVDEELLIKIISEIPVFKNSDGSFNKEEFKRRVTLVFGSEDVFLNNVKDNILKEQLIEAIYPLLSQPYAVGYVDYLAITQERVIKYVEITDSLFKGKIPTPKEADLLKIRDQYKEQFTSVEDRSGEYIYIDLSKFLSKNITVNDTEIKEFYEKNKSNYINNEKRDIEQINFSSKEEADKSYQQIKDKKSKSQFKKIANLEMSKLPSDFAKKVFAAKLNELNSPIQSPVGWHIFKVIKITPQTNKVITEVKNEIKLEILNTKRSKIVEDKRNEILDLISNNKMTFKDIATRAKSTYGSFKNVQGNTTSGNLSEDILRQAFVLVEGNKSSIMEDRMGNLFVVKVNKINSPKLKDIKQIKADLVTLWTKAKRNEELEKISANMILKLSKTKAINSFGYKVKTVKLSRTSKDIPFSSSTVDNLFSSDIKKPIKGELLNNIKIVGIVDSIHNAKTLYTNKDGVRDQEVVNFSHYVSQGYIQGFFEQYAVILRSKYEVKVDQEAIMQRLMPKQEQDIGQ